jgi:phage baseplate assembly protein gpV
MQEHKILPDKFKYDGDLDSIFTIEDLRYRMYINGISATKTVKHAAKEIGVSERTLTVFCEEEEISLSVRALMRQHFLTLKKRIKYKYHE